MFCTNCGAHIADGSRVCSNCGAMTGAQPINTSFDAADVMKNKGLVSFYSFFLPYFWLYFIACKESEYARFFANNAIILMIFPVAISLVCIVPILGWLVGAVGWVFYIVCLIMNFVNALNGRANRLPLFLGNIDIIK